MPYETKRIDSSPWALPQGVEEILDLLAARYQEVPFDRQTARETINALLGLGFRIEPPDPAPRSPGDAAASAARSLDACRLQGEDLLRLGEPLRAYDVLADGAEHFPDDPRLRQLLGLALARSGAPAAANRLLTKLVDEGLRDEETLGLLARTHKDFGLAHEDAEEAQRHLVLAHRHYSAAYASSGGYWSGINAATVALLLGEKLEADDLARAVRRICRAELDRAPDPTERYWLLSTLGEAALILGAWSEAEDWYRQATRLARGHWGNLQSTRRHARVLLARLGEDAGRLDGLFPIPRVCVFSGHMLDQPGRSTPRFPPRLEGAVRGAITDRLRALSVGFGYASAACGADILFHEALQDLGAESHVVLPYKRDAFCRDSVELVPDAGWVDRFREVLARGQAVQEISTRPLAGGEFMYEYANLYLQGLARSRARSLETELVALAVWDGRPGDGPGGTASSVQHWRECGLRVEVIDLGEMLRGAGMPWEVSSETTLPPEVGQSAETTDEFRPEICGLLFADAVGFSKLEESEISLFVRHFLGMAADLMRSSPRAPQMANTWGDGLYCVFARVGDAGRFALDLCERVKTTDWRALRLPALGTRIGLHAGPVYACTDPVTGRRNYVGAHVSRAARIEPITPPDQVYASEAFVALAMAEGADDLHCEYVGQTPLAKNFGRYPTYVVSRLSGKGTE